MAKISVKTDKPTYTHEFTEADEPRAMFFGNPHIDHLFSAVAALGAEVWALRRRQRITEKLLEQHGSISAEMIQKYVPTAEDTAAWNVERQELVANIFHSFEQTTDIPYKSSLHPRS